MNSLNKSIKYGRFPEVVRMDCGTQNVTISTVQEFICLIQDHIYKKSSQWWIQLFKNLVIFDSVHLGHIKELLQFYFMNKLRYDLVKVKYMKYTCEIYTESDHLMVHTVHREYQMSSISCQKLMLQTVKCLFL